MSKPNSTLTAERLRELLTYDSSTGEFIWRVQASPRALIGAVAGASSEGYVTIKIEGRQHRAHRLAWLYVHGQPPAGEIDHKNGDRNDNRIANLRDVSRAVNQQNKRRASKNNQLGLLGVTTGSSGSYDARIKVAGVLRRIGAYETPEAAHAAYLEAKQRLHPGFHP